MLTYSFNGIGSESLYQHLYNCIKKDILAGVLRPDCKLPSKRSFAKNLGISTITVENAYAQLQSEGYIYSVPKRGFFVSDISGIPKSAPAAARTVQAQAAETHPLTAADGYFADFVSNRTNPANFPFATWAKLMREVISERKADLMQNAPYGGVYELRTAICRHLKQFRNMEIRPEQVIIGAGTDYLYGLLIQLLGHDKVYAIENPGYRKLSHVYRSHHVACRYVSLDQNGVCISSLEDSGADIVHISPGHHYPTGIVTSIGRRYELLGWAAKSDSRYIIEDDYDSEFRLTGKPIPMLQSIDVMEKVIYMNTFSKSLASTIRISYMVLPMHLVEKYDRELSFYSCAVSTFEQYTLARFIEEGYFEKHINRMRTHYKNLRNAMLDAIRTGPLASHAEIMEEDSGLHFLMRVDTALSDDEIVAHAKRKGIHISCLSHYFFEGAPDCDHTLIMNYSGIDADCLNGVIAVLAEILL